MTYTITLDKSRIDLDVIHRLVSNTHWSPNIRRDVVETAFAKSIVALAIDDRTNQVVGVARVVSDLATFAWLCDVVVEKEHRGQGLAKRMIAELERHPQLQTLRRWSLATRDAHGLYEKFGYERASPEFWME